MVSFSPILSFIGLMEVTTGALLAFAFLATAGIAARKKTGMARRARRVRRLIEHGIGGSGPHLEPYLDDLAEQGQILDVDLALPEAVAAVGELWPLLPALERVQVAEVLVDDPEGRLGYMRTPVAGHHRLRPFDEQSEPRERCAIVVQPASRREPRNLQVGDVVAADEQPGEPGQH